MHLIGDNGNMSAPESALLPCGAKGIDLGEIVVQFRNDKIILVRKSDGAHYTLHAGHRSGVLDVHRTRHNSADGEDPHEKLFAIPHDELEKALGDLAWVAYAFMRLFRRLRLGWLSHNHITIVRA